MYHYKESGLLSIKSIACSIGGIQDRGIGLDEEGLRLVNSAIERNGLTPFRADAPPISAEGDVTRSNSADSSNGSWS